MGFSWVADFMLVVMVASSLVVSTSASAAAGVRPAVPRYTARAGRRYFSIFRM
tara:strand:+ start:89 stop:247 length:159 start_codon:yes stop_codon:yes gene_type:complete